LYLCALHVFKKAAILCFVICIVLQSGFVAVVNISKILSHKAYVKSILKRELKSGKFNAELVCFTEVQLSHAEWEHSREFFLGEEKYDVVKTVDSGGIKIYHCINDKKEKELFKTLDKHQKQNNLLEDVIKKFCLNTHTAAPINLYHQDISLQHRDYFRLDYTFFFLNANFRPPSA